MRMVNGRLNSAVRSRQCEGLNGQNRLNRLIASAMHSGAIKRGAERQAAIASALRTVTTEQAGMAALADALNAGLAEPFGRAVETLSVISGRVIVTGVGKSGHIGSKVAATLASTGTPAFFVHPSETNHCDLGMIARDDAIIPM